MRAFDAAVFADHAERLATHADASHHPLTAHAQMGLHMGSLEPSFGAPPAHALRGISQRLKDPLCRRLDHDFLDDHIVCTGVVHRLFSTYLLSSRRLAPQNAS